MKPFKMESVLKYRRQLEDVAQQELHREKAEEARVLQQVFTARQELASLYSNLQTERKQGTTVDRLRLFENKISMVHENITQLESDLEKQRQKVTDKTELLLKACKERKVLEKLRERQNNVYRKYLDKKETTMLDEIAVLYHER